MSAANRRMTMAWVWPALVLLARLTTAEEPRRDAHGALAGSEALISDSEPPMETRSGGGLLPVLVWKFVKDAADASDLGRPQFLCSDTSLSVRLSLIRYSDLHLQDGKRLAWLQQGCDGSIGTVGPWLLLKLPYTSCHVTSQVSNGTWFHQLKLRYFDHLLRENMTAVVACEDPATWTLPAVSCRSTEVAVKLPQGSRLQKVKALGKDVVVGRVQTTTTPGPVLVQISTPADKDSMFEVIYLDSAGEMSTMLAACFSAARGDARDRRRRALQHQDQWDWGVNPHDSFSVEPTQGTEEAEMMGTVEPPCEDEETTTTVMLVPVIIPGIDDDSKIFDLWGLNNIPEGPHMELEPHPMSDCDPHKDTTTVTCPTEPPSTTATTQTTSSSLPTTTTTQPTSATSSSPPTITQPTSTTSSSPPATITTQSTSTMFSSPPATTTTQPTSTTSSSPPATTQPTSMTSSSTPTTTTQPTSTMSSSAPTTTTTQPTSMTSSSAPTTTTTQPTSSRAPTTTQPTSSSPPTTTTTQPTSTMSSSAPTTTQPTSMTSSSAPTTTTTQPTSTTSSSAPTTTQPTSTTSSSAPTTTTTQPTSSSAPTTTTTQPTSTTSSSAPTTTTTQPTSTTSSSAPTTTTTQPTSTTSSSAPTTTTTTQPTSTTSSSAPTTTTTQPTSTTSSSAPTTTTTQLTSMTSSGASSTTT
ncbi:mucin-2-like [Amphiprion ocellaris]|uniref:mucin-2-like n=1 Tax=Amphiprion ocellaris TaxID=80972 RepID=UPI002410FEF7|nr:mucin-2-like [Amphiprion ocellaris]